MHRTNIAWTTFTANPIRARNRATGAVGHVCVMVSPECWRCYAADWNAVIGTNLTGSFAFCKAVAKQMAFKQRSGRIINVSSIAAEHVNVGQANYAASKGALNSLTFGASNWLLGR